MKHTGTKTIQTERLTLRKLEYADAEMMFNNWTSDDLVTRFLRWDAHKTIDETNTMLKNWVDSYQFDSTYYWGIYLKAGEMIGSIGITIISECDLKGGLGYKIGSRWWNKGYTSEAAKAVIDYMFMNTDIERIESHYALENPASGKVMEKVGMCKEGVLRHYYKTRDGFQDCCMYGLIRNEWKQTINPYESCPTVEMERFTLRLIEQNDSKDLYQCYHDENAVTLMNDDNCDFSFFMETEEKMTETIDYWIDFYKKDAFIRFSIVDNKSGKVIGTIEGFGGETGVLRIDLVTTYETTSNILEILTFAKQKFKAFFGNNTLVTKAIPSAIERRNALEKSGWKFIGTFNGYTDYYQISLK